jgi:hypothetical protein
MPAGADHVGQGVCVTLVALGTGASEYFPMPRSLFRVDTEYAITGGQ